MYTNGNGKSASVLEREADETRERLVATLDELRHRMTPGQVVDQVVEFARDSGGGEFARNLGQQMLANPMPVVLMGAGLAWLMLGPRSNSSPASSGAAKGGAERSAQHAADRAARESRAAARDAASAARRGLHDAGETVSNLSDGASDTMRNISSRAADTASAVAGRVSSAADAAWEGGHRIADAGYSAGSSLSRVFREQPLLVGAMGVAIGAAIAAALPQTEVERDYVGPTSDAFKEEAQRAVQEHYEQLKAAASGAVSAAREEVDRQFDQASDVVRSAGDRVSEAADRAMGAVEQGVKEAKSQLSAEGKDSAAAGKKSATVGAGTSTGTLPGRSERA